MAQHDSFLGVNVQYYDEGERKSVVNTLTCAGSKKTHSSQKMCEMFAATLLKFEILKKMFNV